MVTGKTKESIESGSVKEDGEHKSDKDEPESGEELEDGEVIIPTNIFVSISFI